MKSKTITFDFDNTIAMSHMDISDDEVKYVFEEYNQSIIDLIKKYIDKGHDVHIVTARVPAKEALFPEDTVRAHLDRLSLSYYFTDDRIHYTSDTPKLPTLKKLGSTLHYDDNMQEHIDNYGGIPVKHPYDYYPDTDHVAKAIIYDIKDNILLLKRTDGGRQWDLPGGHLKNIEVNRGPEGFEEGLEREVAEETGLILPFSEKIGFQKFNWNDKTSQITFFISKFDKLKPDCNLMLQNFMENDRFEWIPLDNMYNYAKNGTQVLRKAIELAKERGILTEEGRFQALMKRNHRKMKQKLIGMGDNKDFGGGNGHSRPKMDRSKSAPAGFGVLEEENLKKKRKIRVKIVQNIDEKRQKKAKKRQKRGQNRAKKHYHWAVGDWFYGGGYGDSGGDGGGE